MCRSRAAAVKNRATGARRHQVAVTISDVERRGLGATRVRQTLLVVLAAAFMACGTVTASAFTLVTVTVILSPTSGVPTAPFTARATFPANCTNTPGPYSFYF